MPAPNDALTRALAMLAGLRPSVEPQPKRRPRSAQIMTAPGPSRRPPSPKPYGLMKE